MIKFGKFYRATFHLKSGNTITFNCKDIKITKNETIQSYNVNCCRPGSIFYCDINEIEAITYKMKFGFWSC